jgi:hypothetical protein
MVQEINTKDDMYLAKVNLAALVRITWETQQSRPVEADDVKVTVDYGPVAEFLETYISVGDAEDLSFLRPESIPDLKLIQVLIQHKIDCGVGSGYIGREDFNVVDVDILNQDRLQTVLEQVKGQERPY